MQTITLPEMDLYVTDERITAEWYVNNVEYRAAFNIVEVAEDSEIDADTAAVMFELAVVDETVEVLDDWAFEDVPAGVVWAVDQVGGLACAADAPADDDDDRRRQHGGGFA